ncbi:hypothetical protein HLV38_00145 [Berryella wangjianweii]|uniref:Bacterial transcriptional activator domain-containing protein n=1 Tax=Berryella wangjianweii TaxID=2734634 RepID=A0A6M8IZA9_9ACTN|nr:BTAD domain-containing putative transcriptional regulator [Berryella wangjianweii]QKF06704.1 hypothetical protein HLV38_00145 [Berryella wangjianweii]
MARFIVGPACFGKSCVAIEYAETVFGLQHVIWIPAASPCFLRDLDEGVIAPQISQVDGQAALVVFDDLPSLDDERARAFSRTIDALLESGVEVMVTCVPIADRYGGLQRDRLRATASDLLLTIDELEHARAWGEWRERVGRTVPLSARVASLAWSGSPHARVRLLEALAAEERLRETTLAIVHALVMGDGVASDLVPSRSADPSWLTSLAADNPYLGIDCAADRFRALEAPLGEVLAAFSPHMDGLATQAGLSSREALATLWARQLCGKGRADRAIELMRSSVGDDAAMTWVESENEALLRAGCLASCLDLLDGCCLGVRARRARAEALRAVRLLAMGERVRARDAAKAAAFSRETGRTLRLTSLAVLALADDTTLRQRALGELRLAALRAVRWAPVAGSPPDAMAARFDQLVERVVRDGGPIARDGAELGLAMGAVLAAGPAEGLARVWEAIESALADDVWLALLVAEALSRATRERALHLGGAAQLAPLAATVRRWAAADEPFADALRARAGLAFEEARLAGLLPDEPPMSVAAMLALKSWEAHLAGEAERYRAGQADRDAARLTRVAAGAGLRTSFGSPRRRAPLPLLFVRLFGAGEVRIGGEDAPPVAFGRAKAITLLALLALHVGRESSFESLAASLWPASAPDDARRNLYTVWSQLRRGLSLPNGQCPYLIRRRSTCLLNASLVRCDVTEFSDLCRSLMFGDLDADQWTRLAAAVETRFCDDLMFGEHENRDVADARRAATERLVDALVAASQRLMAQGGAQQGLWMARLAVQRDRTREDAHLALMRAQVKAGQRTAALASYLACRRVLSEELGIDPSREMQTMYRTLIDACDLSDASAASERTREDDVPPRALLQGAQRGVLE